MLKSINIPLFFKIAKFYSTEFLVYPIDTFALIMRRVFVVGLLILFWALVQNDNSITGLQIVPYIMIATGVQFLTIGQNMRHGSDVAKDIKTGMLNNLLIKPTNELSYQLAVYSGRNVLEMLFSIVNIAIGIILLSDLDPARMGLFLVSLIPAFIIGYACNVFTAAMAFWITDINYFRMSAYFLIRIISGMFIPLTFFAGLTGTILQFLPFSSLAFVPGYILTGDDSQHSLAMVAVGFVWSYVMFVASVKFWNHGVKQYGAIGI